MSTVTLLAPTTLVASGTGASVDVGGTSIRNALALQVVATDPSVDVNALLRLSIETSADDATWRIVGGIDLTGEVSREWGVCGLSRYVRLRWTLTAEMATIRLAVDGESVTSYVAPPDLPGASRGAFDDVTPSDQALACIAASVEADSYLASVHTLPLTAAGRALTKHVGALAAADLMFRRGYVPEGPDAAVVDARDQAVAWLRMVASGKVVPSGIVDSTPDTVEPLGVVYSDALRGW